MRAVITVVGKDKPGILAYIATKCAEREINIVDVNFRKVADDLETAGNEHHLKVHVMHEDIFNSMHTI